MSNWFTPEVKSQWVDALRSDDYVQTKYELKCDRGFCCLGVLAEIMDFPRTSFSDNEEIIEQTYDKFRDTLGIEQTGELYRMNDIKNKTFAEIADWIEGNL